MRAVGALHRPAVEEEKLMKTIEEIIASVKDAHYTSASGPVFDVCRELAKAFPERLKPRPPARPNAAD
jgi:hypothetical protein